MFKFNLNQFAKRKKVQKSHSLFLGFLTLFQVPVGLFSSKMWKYRDFLSVDFKRSGEGANATFFLYRAGMETVFFSQIDLPQVVTFFFTGWVTCRPVTTENLKNIGS